MPSIYVFKICFKTTLIEQWHCFWLFLCIINTYIYSCLWSMSSLYLNCTSLLVFLLVLFVCSCFACQSVCGLCHLCTVTVHVGYLGQDSLEDEILKLNGTFLDK